jgi:hypothetical protein
MNVKPESNEELDPRWYCSGKVPDVGNGYEYDCEPREYSDAAKKQWYEGIPEFLEKRIAEQRQAKAA